MTHLQDRFPWLRSDYDGPTPGLAEYLRAYEETDLVAHMIDTGHLDNLLWEAIHYPRRAWRYRLRHWTFDVAKIGKTRYFTWLRVSVQPFWWRRPGGQWMYLNTLRRMTFGPFIVMMLRRVK